MFDWLSQNWLLLVAVIGGAVHLIFSQLLEVDNRQKEIANIEAQIRELKSTAVAPSTPAAPKLDPSICPYRPLFGAAPARPEKGE